MQVIGKMLIMYFPAYKEWKMKHHVQYYID